MSAVGNHFSGFPAAASRCAAIPRSTSRSGTCSARRPDLPLYQLLGGLSRDRIRIYNTCAGAGYNRPRAATTTRYWCARGGAAQRRSADDLDALHAPRRPSWRKSLLDDGISAMKIWPFDAYRRSRPAASTSRSPDLRARARAVRGDPRGGRRADRHHVEFHGALAAAGGAPDRRGARGARDLLARGPDRDAPARRPRRLHRHAARPGRRQREPRHQTWFREALERGAIDVVHLRHGLDRRPDRGAARSRRWPRPSTGRSHPTTAPAR